MKFINNSVLLDFEGQPLSFRSSEEEGPHDGSKTEFIEFFARNYTPSEKFQLNTGQITDLQQGILELKKFNALSDALTATFTLENSQFDILKLVCLRMMTISSLAGKAAKQLSDVFDEATDQCEPLEK